MRALRDGVDAHAVLTLKTSLIEFLECCPRALRACPFRTFESCEMARAHRLGYNRAPVIQARTGPSCVRDITQSRINRFPQTWSPIARDSLLTYPRPCARARMGLCGQGPVSPNGGVDSRATDVCRSCKPISLARGHPQGFRRPIPPGRWRFRSRASDIENEWPVSPTQCRVPYPVSSTKLSAP